MDKRLSILKNLKFNNVVPGCKVILCLENSILFTEYLFALWTIGVCVVPISTQSTHLEIKYLINSIKPKLIVYSGGIEEYFSNFSFENIESALILFTSGSTGSPKGVVISQKAIIKKLEIYRENLKINQFSNTLCMLPLNFGHGLFSNFLFPLLSDQQVILTKSGAMDTYSSLGEIIDTYEITCFSSVPSILKIASNFSKEPQKSSLKKIYCASATLDKETWSTVLRWSSGISPSNMYGMTELLSWVSGDIDHGNNIFEESTFNLPWEADVKLKRENEQNEFGEILLRSKAMMSEYFNDKVNTEKAFEDGWFKTGDLGTITNGKINLIGRVDDVINLGGVKVYPSEINKVLKFHPDITDCYSFGLSKSEKTQCYGIGCVVIPKPGSNLDLAEVRSFCIQHLSSYKIPTQFKVIDHAPLNQRGKVDLKLIKENFLSTKVKK